MSLLTSTQAMTRLNAALDGAWQAKPLLGDEAVPAASAINRVLAKDVFTPTDIPAFRRSSVDGYAMRSADAPGQLRVIGEVLMGQLSGLRVEQGQAVRVPTGGFVVDGADAVLMIEDAQTHENGAAISTTKTLAPGENTIHQGEDLRAGDAAIRAGTRLREQDIAGLLSLGITQVHVKKQPRVALISSGDELVSSEAAPGPGQIRETNAAMLAALVRKNGGLPIVFDTLPDQRPAFEAAAQRAMREADVVVFIAASSVGERDFVPQIVAGMGQPGIVAHRIAFRPGKPALFAACDGKPVFGLPGNPISALMTGMLFLAPTLWRALGAHNPPAPAFARARLAQDFRSPADLEQWFPVLLSPSLCGDEAVPAATPIPMKSNLIFSLVRADGVACARIGVDQLPAGQMVDVRLF